MLPHFISFGSRSVSVADPRRVLDCARLDSFEPCNHCGRAVPQKPDERPCTGGECQIVGRRGTQNPRMRDQHKTTNDSSGGRNPSAPENYVAPRKPVVIHSQDVSYVGKGGPDDKPPQLCSKRRISRICPVKQPQGRIW